MACLGDHDQVFGPRVDPSCRFDFTVAFEDVFFACVPAALLVCLAPVTLVALLRRPFIFPLKSKLLACQVSVVLGLLATQLALLILRCEDSSSQSSASLAADLLTFLAAITILVLSVIQHRRSQRSSSLVSLYYSVYVVLGIARARTLWLINPGGTVAATLVASLVLTVLALALDSVKCSGSHPAFKDGTSPEQTSGFWNRAVFAWLAPTFRLGYAQVISVDDLPSLDPKLGSDQLYPQLASTWEKFGRRSRHSLLRACFRSYLLSFLSAIVPRLCLTAFTFSQPFLLNSTVLLVQRAHPDGNYGRGLIAAWALVFVGIAVSNSVFQYQNFRFVTRLRGSLTALVYRQALQLREAGKGKVTALAILGADIPQIVAGFQFLHEVWASLLDVAIATWLLERKLSLACLAPVALVFMFISITSRISGTANIRQRHWIEKLQERLKATSNLLGSMKAIKMLGLTSTVSRMIQRLRKEEIKASTSYRKTLLTVLLLSNTPLNLAPTVTFAVYVIISVYWKGSTLEVSQAFSALALISLLTAPVMLFTQILPRVRQAMGCFDRIQEYCNYGLDLGCEQTDDSPVSSFLQDVTSEAFEMSGEQLNRRPNISISKGTFRRKNDGPAVLKNINLSIQAGSITALVGPVGSGKSTLLESLLGETIGSLSLHGRKPPDSVSYCSQQPWLENKTIRESIIGGNAYDHKWYGSVLAACDLESDIASQPQQDQTRIGSKGVGLSGGQKQRIALARAIYARSTLIILDDAFSGMDAHTAETVSTRLLGPGGLLRRRSATVVLATTNRRIVAQADRVVALSNGEIVSIERPQELLARNGCIGKLGMVVSSDVHVEDGEDANRPKSNMQPLSTKARAPDDIRRTKGELSTYQYYFSRSGYWFLIGNLLSVGVWIFLTEFATIWIKWWSEDDEVHPNRNVGMYMSVYAAFGVVGTVCSCFGGWFLLVRMISRSAESLHSDLLEAALKAPFWFFTSTDSGELLNRFSQDIELVDMGLPAMLSSYITSTTQCLIKLIILLFFSQYLGVAVPILGTVIYFLQRFYLRTSRQVRLLGIEAKAPLYSYITDCVDGAVTIRAFGWESRYLENLYHKIDYFQRPEYMQSCVQNWLTFVLDTIVAALAVVLVATIVTWHDKFDAGSVGVALLMIIGFSSSLMRVIKSWTSMESSIGAVARIKRFVDETEKEDQVNDVLDPSWPQAGSLEINDLVASHSPTAAPVLKNITLSIPSGQHLAICGRSGSGKTSLILSVLRMMHIEHSKIKIDGIDVTSTSPEGLRQALNVVPQDPFLMPGPVRFNADPSGTASDQDIIQALTRVKLWDNVREQGGLDKDMDTSAWSAGQKQLFCLARAMIKKSRILILDEAMSSVDHDTEILMQEIIDTEFKHTTVLAIMHRLNHVTNYDKVALLESGELLEFDEPTKLIEQDSRFAELWRANKG